MGIPAPKPYRAGARVRAGSNAFVHLAGPTETTMPRYLQVFVHACKQLRDSQEFRAQHPLVAVETCGQFAHTPVNKEEGFNPRASLALVRAQPWRCHSCVVVCVCCVLPPHAHIRVLLRTGTYCVRVSRGGAHRCCGGGQCTAMCRWSS